MILSAKNVTKTYQLEGGDLDVLKGISLDIKEGEFISIIGPSGSGKSTLMHIIGLLDTPSTGSVILEGKEVAKLNEGELAKLRNKHIGFVFQQYNLLSKTSAVENVELPMVYGGVPAGLRRQKAISLLQMVGLGDRLYHRPNQLSGGQQQRVAIARSLAMDPTILLADEPTGNLDSKTGQDILKFFHQLNNQGRTIVLVTHDSHVASQAKRVVQIRDGVIIKDN